MRDLEQVAPWVGKRTTSHGFSRINPTTREFERLHATSEDSRDVEKLPATSEGFARHQKVSCDVRRSRDGRRFLATSEGYSRRQIVSRDFPRFLSSEDFLAYSKYFLAASEGFSHNFTGFQRQELKKCVAVCAVTYQRSQYHCVRLATFYQI